MPRLYLVRHGTASAGFGADRDPGLDQLGRAEAEAVADVLAPVGPLPVRVSPLRRCRETAAPLQQRWDTEPVIEPAIAEVATPTDELDGRAEWLRRALGSTWDRLEPGPQAWRQQMLDTVAAIDTDTVLITHFVVINAVIGAATGDDRVLIERLANGSVTTVDHGPGGFELVTAGVVGTSEVL
ncbi:MAG: histidine phosphatase family protein [Acidimicrobiales bacterium]|nr:histidine phosphatase family protein [Acidimicrobiales bacterium]